MKCNKCKVEMKKKINWLPDTLAAIFVAGAFAAPFLPVLLTTLFLLPLFLLLLFIFLLLKI